jgi:DNA replication protein DnaC
MLAVRSALKAPTIFLKRQPNELRINNYNSACLSAWRANMDIQFVLDVYACAMYIVSYISKAQKGMSELLRTACNEARKGNATLKQQVRDIGNKFLNNVEISAQEAVYIVLQLPMRKSSRQVVFINTSPPEDRVRLLKPLQEINEMDDDSDEIYASGLIKRYTKRPSSLEHVTLADWAAWYDQCGKPYVKQSQQLDIDDLPLETEFNNDNNNDDENEEEQNEKYGHKNKKRSKARIIRSVCFNKEVDSEKHYRELIMLFTSWRNEVTDLLGNCSSYQQYYTQVKDIIDEQMKQYAMCSEDLNEIQNELQSMDENDDNYDQIAPGTQHIECQDESEGAQDLHPDFNEHYDLSADLGIPSAASNTEQLILNELQDDDYRKMIQKLNEKQKEFFYHVLHHIKTSDKPIYCFLSGGAGVGKSHLTKSLYQAALKYYNTRAGDNFQEVKILMLAPTGKAAYNIKGNTIHSALAIPACQSLRNYKPLDSSRLNTLRCLLGGVKLIFLDEISMVGSTMFNIQINNRLKDIKGSKEDFGGVSVIAIGDLFQLEPVMDRYIFKNLDDSDYAVLAPNKWQEHFNMFELEEIMRQRDSKVFAEILNRLREGKHTNDDIIQLKQRIIEENSIDDPTDAPHLFIQNKKVNEFNERVHYSGENEKYSMKAVDSVIGANSAQLRLKILAQIPDDPRKTKQIRSDLHLSVGERTEIALNVRIDDGMTNGAGTVIKKIQLNQKDKPSGIIWVQFDHDDVGEKTRHENKHLYAQGIESTWTPIKPITTQFAVGKNQTAQVVRKQFPLRPAAAKTIHRSQGDTEHKIVVNFNTKRAIPHIHYVGLSRVTTMEGLYITDLCEEKIAVNPHVVSEMELLRNERALELNITPMYNIDKVAFKLCYLNTRSLHKHIDDIRHDFNFKNTDINIFSETRFMRSDSDNMYHIDNYNLFRNDGHMLTSRPPGGMAVYSRVDLLPGFRSAII